VARDSIPVNHQAAAMESSEEKKNRQAVLVIRVSFQVDASVFLSAKKVGS